MSGSVKPKRTLVAGDQLVCNLVRETLTQYGHTVEVCTDGNAVLQTYRPTEFTLLVLDVMMPHRSGLEIVRELRKNGDRVPIVLMSSYMSEDLAEAVKGIENLERLSKPFGLAELRTAVERAVGSLTC